MSLFKDMYYVILSNGLPVDVTQDYAAAQQIARQFSTDKRKARVLPCVPAEVDTASEGDFQAEEPTKPNPQLDLGFDLSDLSLI